jgi:hypothetical protein
MLDQARETESPPLQSVDLFHRFPRLLRSILQEDRIYAICGFHSFDSFVVEWHLIRVSARQSRSCSADLPFYQAADALLPANTNNKTSASEASQTTSDLFPSSCLLSPTPSLPLSRPDILHHSLDALCDAPKQSKLPTWTVDWKSRSCSLNFGRTKLRSRMASGKR